MYDASVVRELFEKWGHEEVVGDPGEKRGRSGRCLMSTT